MMVMTTIIASKLTNPAISTFCPNKMSMTHKNKNFDENRTDQSAKNFAGLIFWPFGYENREPNHLLKLSVQNVSACNTTDANNTVDAEVIEIIAV